VNECHVELHGQLRAARGICRVELFVVFMGSFEPSGGIQIAFGESYHIVSHDFSEAHVCAVGGVLGCQGLRPQRIFLLHALSFVACFGG